MIVTLPSDHEELWQPAWGIRTGSFGVDLVVTCDEADMHDPSAIVGLRSFFPLKGQAAQGVGAIEAPISERKRLANL